MKIDKIFIINLESRTDRKDEILNEMQKIKANELCEIEVFNAISPTIELIEKWNPNFLNPIPKWAQKQNIDPNHYRLGSFGCLLSHFSIIKKSLSLGYENILIFEDDAEFTSYKEDLSTILNKYSNLIKKALDNFGIMYLGSNNNEKTIRKIIDNIYLTYGSLAAHSYIINKNAMQFISDNLISYPKEIDQFYQEIIQQQFQCITIYPPLVQQRKSFSNILNKNVVYNFKNIR
tara:strand:+ start:3027 stop:3725 length:699 start_codon:yes stop_codon:yes gene_type:complete